MLGYTVAWWLAQLPHSKTVLGLILMCAWALSGCPIACMLGLLMTLKLTPGVGVSVDGCLYRLSLRGPVMNLAVNIKLSVMSSK